LANVLLGKVLLAKFPLAHLIILAEINQSFSCLVALA
jgi:hypothetical protein